MLSYLRVGRFIRRLHVVPKTASGPGGPAICLLPLLQDMQEERSLHGSESFPTVLGAITVVM